jgi:hypothetical protein
LPKFLKHYSSEARTALARLIDAKAAAADESREAQARVDRLTALAGAAEPVRAKLSALDASEAQAFADWARDSSLPVPAADTAARVDITRELAEAEAKGAAASRAVSAMRGEIELAHVKANEADQALAAAVMTVALEAVGPIADEARAAMATIALARMRGQAIDRMLGAAMEGMMPSARADYAPSFAAAGESLKNAFALPLPNEAAESGFMASVRSFLIALRGDASATLESV